MHADEVTTLGCTGHRRIPAGGIDIVSERIRAEIERHPVATLVGVCSLAVGADQMFARAVLAAGGRLHAVIPSRGYEATFDGDDCGMFGSLLDRAHTVETLDFPEPGAAAFRAAGHRVVDLSDVVIAVWDGRRADRMGGTADTLVHAVQRAKPIVVVWPYDV